MTRRVQVVVALVVASLVGAATPSLAERPRYYGFYEGTATVTASPYYAPGDYAAEAAIAETDSGIVGFLTIVFDAADGLGGSITHRLATPLPPASNSVTLRYQDRVCGAGSPVGKCYPHDPTGDQYSFEGRASFLNGELHLATPAVLAGVGYAPQLPFDEAVLTRRQTEPRTSFDGAYENLEYIWPGTLIVPTPLPLSGSNTVEIAGGQITSWAGDGGSELPPGIIVADCFDDARGLGWMNQQGTWFYDWVLHSDGEGVAVVVTFDDVAPDCGALPDPLAGAKLDRVHDDLVGVMFERTAPATGPGRVVGLTVAKSGGSLDLSWQPDCGTASRYSVYRGDLALGYASAQAEACAVNGTAANVVEGTGSADFFLVVPTRMNRAGSYGLDSRSIRRLPPASACYDDATLDSCAP